MGTVPVQVEGSSVPHVREGVDVLGADLAPTEAFLLFRVDGKSSVQTLAGLAGVEEDEAREIFGKLAAAGLIGLVGGGGEAASNGSTGRAASAESTPRPEPIRVVEEVVSSYDPAELYEDVQIPLERRRAILDAFYSLDKHDHYEILAVPQDADKKAIRSAYFALSKVFHTDTLFGKELGSYRLKMEVVFKRLTTAYHVLSKPKAREDYDAYLRSLRGTRAAQAALDAVLGASAPAPPLHTPRPAQAPPPPPRPVSAAPPPPGSTASPAPAPPHVSSEEAKRRARELLARKLGTAGRARPAAPSSSATPAPPPVSAAPRSATEIARDLSRTLMSVSTHTGGVSQARRLVDDAKRHEAAGDLVAAANGYRLALEVAPGDAEVEASLQRVSSTLRTAMLPEYERQAKYEEQCSDFAAAAISWQRVANGRPDDTTAHGAAARCLRRSGGDLKQQQHLIRRAVELAPDNLEFRLLAASIYLEAEMPLNAKREVEAAAKLDPNDESVKKLAADLKLKVR